MTTGVHARDLFETLEGLLRLPRPLSRVVLGGWPTPVQPLSRLGRELGVDLWIKRDDRASEAYGGNKVRKLELILGEAKDKGARSVLTIGGVGSHQVTAAAIFAPAIGAVPLGIVYPLPLTGWVRASVAQWEKLNLKLVAIDSVAQLAQGMEAANRELAPPIYMVPSGCSSPLGNLGFVAAGLELCGQIERGELPAPTEIILPCGTGGTIAGLALGLALGGQRSPRLVGVRCGSRDIGTEASVRQQVTAMIKLVERKGGRVLAVELPQLVFLDTEGEYGVPTQESLSAIDLARASEGLELEATYTGRTLAKLKERARTIGGSVLFWHTASSLPPLPPEAFAAAAVPAVLKSWLG